MKKIIVLIIILCILVLSATAISADNSGLQIDNANIYDGMSKSYSGGYKPTIANDKATIVLPLLYNGVEPITNNSITASLDLGSTDKSPFEYANYQKNITLNSNSIGNGTNTVEGYLVKFDIPLNSQKYIGTYPVIINTSFSTTTESNIEKSFTVYLSITDGIDPNLPTDEEKTKEPQPKIIINNYKVTPSVVEAGKEFSVKLTLLNTEKNNSAKNILVTYSATGDVLPNDNKTTFYIDEIKGNKTHNLNLKLKTIQNANPTPQKVAITINYEDSDMTTYSISDEITVEIKQPIRIKFDEVKISKKVNAGDSLPITMQIFNMGKSTLFNVQCTLEMKGAIPEGSSFLGNMESGSSAMAEIYTFFGTLDMQNENSENSEISEESEEKYGLSEGKMIVSYEDQYGNTYTEEVEISTIIEKPVYDTVENIENEPEEEPEKASQWWISIVLLLGIGMIIYSKISYKRKLNKLKREYGDEDI
ncbi:MAG: hypothetical protein ACOWWH_05975 [Eubacteriaceae bacterium]